MKKATLITMILLCAGCVGLRMNQTKGTASYYRLGGQDIRDLYAQKIGTEGERLTVSLGSVHVDEPTIMDPASYDELLDALITANLPVSSITDVIAQVTGKSDVSGIKDKIADIIKGDDDKPDTNTTNEPVNTDDWPKYETRYNIYKENNSTANQNGLWKPVSESTGNPILILPSHMAKVGVETVLIGGKDITNNVRRYTNGLPTLANGLRLHYNAPKTGDKTEVLVTLEDGSQWSATISNGDVRQDPLTFKQSREADVVTVQESIITNIDAELEAMKAEDAADIDAVIGKVNDALEEME